MSRDRTSTGQLAAAALAMQIFALCLLAVLRSDKLIILAYDLPPSPASERFITIAERWNGLMEQAGAAGLTQKVVETVDWLRGGENGL